MSIFHVKFKMGIDLSHDSVDFIAMLLTPKRAVRNWERVRCNEERVRIRAVPAFAEVKKKIREKMLMLAGRARTSGSVAHKS